MKNTLSVNPFEEDIVIEPRRPEPVVAGLNEYPFSLLVAEFEQLVEGGPPRLQHRVPRAQLVTSPQPGYGKSHLISRLFRTLQGRATLIYVRPFQNPALPFHSIVAAIAREMSFPDRADLEACDPDDTTQLESLAHGVLGHLVANLIESGRDIETADDMQQTVTDIRYDPVAAFNRGSPGYEWADWMRQYFDDPLLPLLAEELDRLGVELHSRGWLRVLFAYGYANFDPLIRRICLDWIAGESIEPEEAKRIGLRSSDLPDPEATAEQTNDLCRKRLVDLCRLSGFFRPFVFCFDQTEIYGHNPALARSFGMLVATLVNEAYNHLTVVTSNQTPWTRSILPHIEEADQQRLCYPPISLEGLTRQQGEELVRLRFESWKLTGEDTKAFLDQARFHELFPTDSNRVGARHLLQFCRMRWEVAPDATPEIGARQRATVTLTDYYERHREDLLAKPKRLLFDADTLQWLVKEAASGLPEVVIHTGQRGPFVVGWETSRRRILFGFEGGSNWRRWQAIAREAARRAAANPPLKVVMFRGPDQPAIPGQWKVAAEIEAAKAHVLDLIVLTRDDLAVLYAAYDVYAEALGGDIPFTPEDVIVFLREALAPWWKRFAGRIQERAEPPGPRDDEREFAESVRAIVERAKFLSVDEVISTLEVPATKDEVLKACGFSAEIRIHPHPNMTVLQWQRA